MVKRYVPEVGTAWVRALAILTAGHTLLIAQVTPTEIVSGVARRRREWVKRQMSGDDDRDEGY